MKYNGVSRSRITEPRAEAIARIRLIGSFETDRPRRAEPEIVSLASTERRREPAI